MSASINIAAPAAGLQFSRNLGSPPIAGGSQSSMQSTANSATGKTSATSNEDAQQQKNARIQQLKARDRAVRAHELAHVTVGGKYAGSANLTYERGPDGVLYATGGEVPIDVSPITGDPQATLEKMQVVKRAALAPLNPSAIDRAVAAQAAAQAARASAELAKLRADDQESPGGSVDLLV